jgi:phospho-N-acetylmuramoyl-pentapeptide-transferase
MLYNVIYKGFCATYSILNILRYVTFRSICAFVASFCLVLLIGPKIINFLKRCQENGQPIREDGPQSHLISKKGTPTMGGIMIICSVLCGTFLFADLANTNIWLCTVALLGFGTIGAIDDFCKLKNFDYHGITGKQKLIMQIAIAFVCCYIAFYVNPHSGATKLYFPIFKNYQIELGGLFMLWAIIVMVGSSNAVNLTDGLDGLALGPVIMTSICYAVLSYLVGNTIFSEYLKILYIPGMSEISVFLSSLVGAGLGFMWYNAPPAKVFMGDTGSIAIGGVLGFVALLTKQELIYIIVGGIFVVETISVVLQVLYFKATGKRAFLMAPIHHHFEKKGWPETTIVFRFWIISIILGILALATLKIR